MNADNERLVLYCAKQMNAENERIVLYGAKQLYHEYFRSPVAFLNRTLLETRCKQPRTYEARSIARGPANADLISYSHPTHVHSFPP